MAAVAVVALLPIAMELVADAADCPPIARLSWPVAFACVPIASESPAPVGVEAMEELPMAMVVPTAAAPADAFEPSAMPPPRPLVAAIELVPIAIEPTPLAVAKPERPAAEPVLVAPPIAIALYGCSLQLHST